MLLKVAERAYEKRASIGGIITKGLNKLPGIAKTVVRKGMTDGGFAGISLAGALHTRFSKPSFTSFSGGGNSERLMGG